MRQFYTLGDLDERRCDKGCWEPESKAFDWAREQVFDFDNYGRGELSENDRSDDEVVETYADEYDLWFDEHGNMYERW